MPIHIDAAVCKGCGLCVYYCPKKVLRLSDQMNERGFKVIEVYNENDCIQCQLCEFSCPDLAIFIEKAEKSVARN